MRRKEGIRALLIVVVVMVAWTALPAMAGKGGRSGEYRGKLLDAPRGRVTFEIGREGGEGRVKVLDFTVRSAPLDCPLAPEKAGWEVGGRIRIGPTFKFEYYDDESGGRGGSHIELAGKLLPGGRARGELEIVEEFDEIPACSTGVLDWRAHRRR